MKALTEIVANLPNDFDTAKTQFSQILRSQSDPKMSLSQLNSLLTSTEVPKSTLISSSKFSTTLNFLTNKETSICYMQLFMILSKSFFCTELSRLVEENKVHEMILQQIHWKVSEKNSKADSGSVFEGLDYRVWVGCYLEFLEFLNKFTFVELEFSAEKLLIELFYYELNDLNLQSVFFKSYTKGLRFMRLCNNYYKSIEVCGEVINQHAQQLSPSFFKLFKYLLLKVNKNSSLLLENKKFECVFSSNIIGLKYLVTLFYNSQKPLYKKARKWIFSLLTCFSQKCEIDIVIILTYSFSILIKSCDKSKKIHKKRLIGLIYLLNFKFCKYKRSSSIVEINAFYQEESKIINIFSPLLVMQLISDLSYEFELTKKIIALDIDNKRYGPQKNLKQFFLTSDQILSVKIIDNIIIADSSLIKQSLTEHREFFWELFDDTRDEKYNRSCFAIAKFIKNGPIHSSVEEYLFSTDEYSLMPISVQMEFVYSIRLNSRSARWLKDIKCLAFDNPILEYLIGFIELNPNFGFLEELVELIVNFSSIGCLDGELYFRVIKALFFWVLKNPSKLPRQDNENFYKNALTIIMSKLEFAHHELFLNLLHENTSSIANYLLIDYQSPLITSSLKNLGEFSPELLTLILLKCEEIVVALDPNQMILETKLFSDFNHCPKVILSKLIEILLNFKQVENENVCEEILKFLLNFKDFWMNVSEFQNFLSKCLIPNIPNYQPDLPVLKSKNLRNYGFDLVCFQCKSDSKKIPIVLDVLNLLLLNKSWRKSKQSYWKIRQNWLDPGLEYKGLDNPGTICYSNSFIQQLFHMPTFRDPLLSLYTKEKNCLSALQKVFAKLKFSCQSSVSSKGLIKSCLGPKGLHEQMDTDEFISMLFEKCSKSELGFKFDEIIQKNFIGAQNLEIKCKRCQRVYNKTQDFKSIVLQIYKKEKNSLLNSLKKMTVGENMVGENALFCSVCKRKEDSVMKMSFTQLPFYLIFVVKRFEYDIKIMARTKVNEVFEFTEKVNLVEFFECNTLDCGGENFEYQLKGVINHRGTADQGHYISYVSTSKNEWVEFNDSETSKLSITEVLKNSLGEIQGDHKTTSAYIIIYKKIQEPMKSSNQMTSNFNLTPCEIDFFPIINEKNLEVKFREILFSEHFSLNLIKFIGFQEFEIFLVKYTLSCLFRMSIATSIKILFYRELYDCLSLKAVIYLIEILSSAPGTQEFILCNPYPEHKTFLLTLIEKHITSLDKSFLLSTFKSLLKFYVEHSFSFFKCDVYLNQFFFLVINHLSEDWKAYYINQIHLKLLNKNPIKLNYELENYKNEFTWTENFSFSEEVKEYHQFNEKSPYMYFIFMVKNFDKFGYKVIEFVKTDKFIRNAISLSKTKLGIIALGRFYSLVYQDDIKGALQYLGKVIDSYMNFNDEKKFIMISMFFKYYPGRTQLFADFIEFYLDIFIAEADKESSFISCIIKSLRKLKFNEVALVLSEKTQEKLKNAIEIYLCQREYCRELRQITDSFFQSVEFLDFDKDDEIDAKNLVTNKSLCIYYYGKYKFYEIDSNFCDRILRLEGTGYSFLLLDYIHFDCIEFFK